MLCCLVSESCQRWFGRGEVWVSFGYYARIAKKELWWLLSGFISLFLCVGFVLYSNINAYFLCRDLILAAILQGKYPSIYEGLEYSVFLHGLSFHFLTNSQSLISHTFSCSFVGCPFALLRDLKLWNLWHFIVNFLVHGFCETTKYPVRSLFESGLSLSWDCIYVNWLTQTQLWIILGLIVHFSCCFSESFNSRCEWCIKPQYRRHVSWSGTAGIWYISRWLLSSGQSTSAWYCGKLLVRFLGRRSVCWWPRPLPHLA